MASCILHAMGDSVDKYVPGSLIQEYRIERLLGGGQSVVALATRLSDSLEVILKLPRLESTGAEMALARFHREIEICSRLASPHVARVHGSGQTETGIPFIVFESLTGHDLEHELKASGPLPIGFACTCIMHACKALTEAHTIEVVHRDLKPANLFLTVDEGQPIIKVLDFGMSRMQAALSSLTRTGIAVGSPFYMSPEQIRSSKTVGPESDLWSLGIVLFELLTAQVPFRGARLGEVVQRILMAEPPSLQELRPEVPSPVSEAVKRCLEKSPESRPRSARELATLLSPFADGPHTG